jgi:hypothetical protein
LIQLKDPSVYSSAVAKRQLRSPYVCSVAMNDVKKESNFIAAWTATGLGVSGCP